MGIITIVYISQMIARAENDPLEARDIDIGESIHEHLRRESARVSSATLSPKEKGPRLHH